MTRPTHIAILFSGYGSNMVTLAHHIARQDVPAKIALTICNRPDAQGIARARALGLPCHVIDHEAFDSRAAFEAEMQTHLHAAQIDLICAAGFMRILTDAFVSRWQGRILNIHPSLLPKHKGLHTHKRALEAGDKNAGCTVHYLTAELDSGPIIRQISVPILTGDTPETLAQRVQEKEHIIYPQALDIAIENIRA